MVSKKRIHYSCEGGIEKSVLENQNNTKAAEWFNVNGSVVRSIIFRYQLCVF